MNGQLIEAISSSQRFRPRSEQVYGSDGIKHDSQSARIEREQS